MASSGSGETDETHATAPAAPAPTLAEKTSERLPWFALAAACLTADLWTKHLVFYPVVPEGTVVGTLFEWWDLIIVFNRVVTFGLGSGLGVWVIALLTGGVIVMLARWLWTLGPDDRAMSLSISMIVGGAVGNLYDRALRPLVESDVRPGVRDFLDWYVPDTWRLGAWMRANGWKTHWYTSNVADVLIVCGVILLAWRILRERPTPAAAESPARPEATPKPNGGAT